MKIIIFCILVVGISQYACNDKVSTDKCVYKVLNEKVIDKIDTSYSDSHFGDILLIIAKDSSCKDTNVYNVLIARIYGNDNHTKICRLLDSKNNWQAIKQSMSTNKSKIIKFTILGTNISDNIIYTSDSTKISENLMPTFVVDAKLTEM